MGNKWDEWAEDAAERRAIDRGDATSKRYKLRDIFKAQEEEAQQQIDSIINRELSKALTQKLNDAILTGQQDDSALKPQVYNRGSINVPAHVIADAGIQPNTIQSHTMRDHRDSLRKYQALKELANHISALTERRTRADDNPIMQQALRVLQTEAQQEKAEREALADLHRAHYFPVGDLEGFRSEVVRINKDTWDRNQIVFRVEQSMMSLHINLPQSFVKITGI